MRYLKEMLVSIGLLLSLSVFAAGKVSQNPADLLLSTEEQTYLKGKQQLKMCIDPDWMPFEKIEKGQHIGMSADFMRLFAEKIKIPIVLVPSDTWMESLALGRQRQCDLFALAMKTPEREKFLNFSEPYIGFPLVIVTRYEQIFINDITSILDKKMGVQKGYAYSELLRLKFPSINLIVVENLGDGLEQVRNNQLFGMIGNLPSIAFVFQNKYLGELKISGKLDNISHIGMAMRNDEPLLVSIFNKAIATVDKQQRIRITSYWLTTRYQLGADYKRLVNILSVMTLLFALFLYHYSKLRKHNRLLKHLSITDKLTSIYNRIKLDEQIDTLLSLAERYQTPFSLILLDLDYFKAINDFHGHLMGDYVLKNIAKVLKENIRTVDIVGRWGGEEFLIICPEQTAEGAKILAEKLRLLIAEYPFKSGLTLTSSFGVTCYQALDSGETLIQRADDALYMAKEIGRNCVAVG